MSAQRDETPSAQRDQTLSARDGGPRARDEALAEIAAISRRHGLTPDEVRAVVLASATAGAPHAPSVIGTASAPESGSARSGPLARALAYLGGTFVLAGLAVFVGTNWQGMNSGERIIVTLGSGVACFVLSFLAHGAGKRDRLATPLFILAAILEPAGMCVAFEELGHGGSLLDAEIVVGLVMLAQSVLYLVKTRRTIAVFAALVFGSLAAVAIFARMEIDGGVTGLVVGLAVFLVTHAVDRSRHRVITPFWYFASAATVLLATFDLVQHRTLEIATLAVASGFVYLSTRIRSRTLLATGCLGILAYVGYYTRERFADSVGWPILLIGLGILMMALRAFAVRIHRRYIRTA